MTDPRTQNRQSKLPDYVWKFYVYRGVAGLAWGIYMPIWILFLLDRGFNLATLGLFAGVMSFSMFVFGIPMGIIADKFSRKWSVCLARVLQAISALTQVTTTNYFLVLIFGFVFYGLGLTLARAADSALLYDSLKSDAKEKAFHKTIGNAISLQFAGQVAGNLLCGVIVGHTGLAGPYWAGFVLFLLAAALPAMIKEPPLLVQARSKDIGLTFKGQVSSYLGHMKESFRFIGASSALVFLVFINFVFIRMCLQPQSHFSQPYLKSFAYSSEQISYFYAGFSAISALFAKSSSTIKKILGGKERWTFLLIVFIGAVSLFSLAYAPIGLIAVLAFMGLNLARGLFMPFMEDSLNRRIPSDRRASCISIGAAAGGLFGIIFGPLFGHLADVFSLKASLIIFQWTFFCFLFAGVIWGWKTLGKVPRSEPAASA